MKSARTTYQPLLGRRVLITGGTTGVGRAIAVRRSCEGASVFIVWRHQAELDDGIRELSGSGFPPVGMLGDAARKADLNRIFNKVDQAWGGLDVLINHAAVAAGGLEDDDEDAVEDAVMNNLVGYWRCAKRALTRVTENSRLVLTGSISADHRNPGGCVSVATRAAVHGFAEAFGKEASEKGIKVSLVEPGRTGCDMINEGPGEQREGQQNPEMLKAKDIVVAVEYILTQPLRCNISDLKIVPAKAAAQ